MMRFLFHSSPMSMQLGFLLLRLGTGLISIKIAVDSLFGGVSALETLGAAITSLGIHYPLTFWGIVIAVIELFIGLLLVIGLYTRLAAFVQIFVMIALGMHIAYQTGSLITYPLVMSLCALSILVAGPTSLSCDAYWYASSGQQSGAKSSDIDTNGPA